MASLGAAAGAARASKEEPETIYRFSTPECEVRMSVQQFGSSFGKDFRFRDLMTNRKFCLSSEGEEDPNCPVHFNGSIAVAIYRFYPRLAQATPLKLRERVFTIDHDSRMSPRPPFERDVKIERETASDIQAFGYDRDHPPAGAPSGKPSAVWSLLHQDLYLGDQTAPFLIVHWKHTLDLVSLLDVIPGEHTKVVST
jgi:hypothetical protein